MQSQNQNIDFPDKHYIHWPPKQESERSERFRNPQKACVEGLCCFFWPVDASRRRVIVGNACERFCFVLARIGRRTAAAKGKTGASSSEFRGHGRPKFFTR